MIFELPWMASLSADGVDDNFDNARAGKASRAGAKAARILRVVRMMIRLVRLVKFCKYFKENKHKKGGSATIVPNSQDIELSKMPPESHVGAEMSDRTTKKVIVGMLIMLMVIPLLQVQELEYLNEYGMHMVLQHRTKKENMDAGGNADWNTWEITEGIFINRTSYISMIYEGVEDSVQDFGITPSGRANKESLRSKEKSAISINSANEDYSMTAVFDVSERAKEEALLGILLTTFVIVLLAVGTMTFSRDMNNWVILPIEKMVQLVREISAFALFELLFQSGHSSG